MATTSKKVAARFYATQSGVEPVRAFLLGMSATDRRIIGSDIAAVEFGWPVGMPVCRAMGGGLYEVRSTISDRRIARFLFAFDDDEIVLIHAFIKKTQKTSVHDLALAKARKGEKQ